MFIDTSKIVTDEILTVKESHRDQKHDVEVRETFNPADQGTPPLEAIAVIDREPR